RTTLTPRSEPRILTGSLARAGPSDHRPTVWRFPSAIPGQCNVPSVRRARGHDPAADRDTPLDRLPTDGARERTESLDRVLRRSATIRLRCGRRRAAATATIARSPRPAYRRRPAQP